MLDPYAVQYVLDALAVDLQNVANEARALEEQDPTNVSMSDLYELRNKAQNAVNALETHISQLEEE
jgi:hypothetical protein